MSGADGGRGYLVQTMIAVMDSFDDDEWLTVTLEPSELFSKVDIYWEYQETSCVVQVKSSRNSIGVADVKKWCSELKDNCPEAANRELCLIGPASARVINMDSYDDVKIPTPLNLNYESLISEASHKLSKFLQDHFGVTTQAEQIENKVKELTVDYFTNVSKKISRRQLLETLKNRFLNLDSECNRSLIGEAPKLAMPKTEPDNAWLQYSSKVAKFVGRQNELDELYEFASSDRPFSWWVVIGPGGSGKSRLALEFCEFCETEGWEVGFLQRIDEERYWTQFNPSKNTLVVIDYVANRASLVSEVILRLSTAHSKGNCKIRLLLVERDQNRWWSVVCREDSSSEEVTVLNSLYKNEALALRGLDGLELVNMAKDVFEARGRVWTDEEEHYFSRRIAQTSYGNLPIFAMILAEYSDDVDRDQLLRAVLRREAVRRKLLISKYESECQINNLIFLATLVGGIRPQSGSFRFLENLTCSSDLPTFSQHILMRYSDSVGASKEKAVLSGLQPDLLGERFVLDCMSKSGLGSLIYKELYAEASRIQQDDVIAFIARSIGDFPEDEAIKLFFEVDTENQNQRLFKSKLLLGVSTLFHPIDPLITEQIDSLCTLANQHIVEGTLQKYTALVEYNHGASMMALSFQLSSIFRSSFQQVAENRLQSALSRISENTKMGVTVLLNLGVLFESQNSRECASDMFSRVIDSDQASNETKACALNNRANIFCELGEHSKAIDDRTTVLSLDLTSPDRRFVALFRRGESFVALNDHRASALDMTEIVESHVDISNLDKLFARIIRAINHRGFGDVMTANIELQSVLEDIISKVSQSEDKLRISETYRFIKNCELERASKKIAEISIDRNEILSVRLCNYILSALVAPKYEENAQDTNCPWDELGGFVCSTVNRYRFAQLDVGELLNELNS